MKREEVIEEAAKRLLKDVNPKHGRPVSSQLASDIRLVAGAVFEKAHTTTPPDGWFYMGSHVGAPWLNLEFSEEMDETGLPLWERPVQHTPTDDERAVFDAIADRLGEHSQATNYEIADSGEYETKLRGPVDVEVLAEWLLPTVLGFRRSEVVPEPSTECPQPCVHLSQHDAREGRTCAEHPCTCPEPQAESSDAQEVEFPFTHEGVTLEQDDGGIWVSDAGGSSYWISPRVLAALRAAGGVR